MDQCNSVTDTGSTHQGTENSYELFLSRSLLNIHVFLGNILYHGSVLRLEESPISRDVFFLFFYFFLSEEEVTLIFVKFVTEMT